MGRQSSVCCGGGGGWWRRAVAWWGAVVLCHLVTRATAGLLETNPGLAYNFYSKSCPSAEATVKTITWQMVAANPALAGRLLRLHFHDCFVQVSLRLSPPHTPHPLLPCLCFLWLAGVARVRLRRRAPGPADRREGKRAFSPAGNLLRIPFLARHIHVRIKRSTDSRVGRIKHAYLRTDRISASAQERFYRDPFCVLTAEWTN
jgi:peroxidase